MQFLNPLLLLFTFALHGAFSQNAPLKNYTIRDGLASNHVYKLYQDSKGFIWFTTDNGLSRFDGSSFHNISSKNGLPDNDVFNIAEDGTGRLWVSCFNGTPCYIKDLKVYTPANDSLLKIMGAGGYFEFDTLGGKIFASRYNQTYGGFTIDQRGRVKRCENMPCTRVVGSSFLLTPKTEMGIDYITVLDSNFKEKARFLLATHFDKINTLDRALCRTGIDTFLTIKSKKFMYLYCVVSDKFYQFDSIPRINSFNRSWIVGNKLWANINGKSIIPVDYKLRYDSSRSSIFNGKVIWDLIRDREGNFWGSTFGSGVFMQPNNGISYCPALEGHGAPIVFCADTQNLYVGHNHGVITSIKKDKVFYSRNTGHIMQIKFVDMLIDQNQIIAITPSEIISLDKRYHKAIVTPMQNAKYIERYDENYFLIGIDGSPSICNSKFNVVEKIYKGRTTCALVKKSGDILLGTLFGILRATKQNNGVWVIEKELLAPKLSDYRISFIKQKNDLMIIGTVQNGLLLVKGKDHEYIKMPEKFTELNCKNAFIDKDGTIWLATFFGLFRIRLKESIHDYEIERISEFNGLFSDDVNDVAVINDSVYVACREGLCAFSKTQWVRSRSQRPNPLINGFFANGTEREFNGGEAVLNPDSSSIEIKFATLDFKSLGRIDYRYRLLGLNNNWQATSATSLKFEALPPGKYRFELLAMNSHNAWSKRPLILEFTISPHWWQTWWFRLLILVLAFFLIYLALRISINRRHKKEIQDSQLKRKLAEIELKAIRAQINPHFIFNTLNAIQYFVSTNQNELADESIATLASLIRQTLELSNRTSITLEEEVNYLSNYLSLESLRFEKNFEYTITNLVAQHSAHVNIPPMALQPYVENALRHGLANKRDGNKKLELNFELEGNDLVCFVKDNGVGREALKRKDNESIHKNSMGRELSESKLRMYEQLAGKKVSTTITDLYNGDKAEGTVVIIRIEQ